MSLSATELLPHAKSLIFGYIHEVNNSQTLQLSTYIPLAICHIIIGFFWIPYYDAIFKCCPSASRFMKLISQSTYCKYDRYYPQELLRYYGPADEQISLSRNQIQRLFPGKFMLIMQIITDKEFKFSASKDHILPQLVIALELNLIGRYPVRTVGAQIYVLNERKPDEKKHVKLSGKVSFGFDSNKTLALVLHSDEDRLIEIDMYFEIVKLNVNKLNIAFGAKWLSNAYDRFAFGWRLWKYKRCPDISRFE